MFRKSSMYAIVVLSGLVGYCSANDKHQDGLVGAYTVISTNLASGEVSYGTAQYFADGNIIFTDSTQEQQPTVTCPQGCYGTIAQGTWKKIGKRLYRASSTSVFIAKDPNPPFPGIAVTPPSGRFRFDTVFKLSKDCQRVESQKTTLTFYALDDIELKESLGELPLSYVAQKVNIAKCK